MFSHHFSRHWCCIYVCFYSRARLEWRDRKHACHPGYRELSERSLQTLDSSHDAEPATRAEHSLMRASKEKLCEGGVQRRPSFSGRRSERSEIERGRKQRRLRHAERRCLVRGSEGWRGYGPRIQGYSRSGRTKVARQRWIFLLPASSCSNVAVIYRCLLISQRNGREMSF